jgi:hypothetical protein
MQLTWCTSLGAVLGGVIRTTCMVAGGGGQTGSSHSVTECDFALVDGGQEGIQMKFL